MTEPNPAVRARPSPPLLDSARHLSDRAARLLADGPAAGVVTVWVTDLAALPDHLAAASPDVHTPGEIASALRRPASLRRRYLLRRLVRRVLLAAHAGIDVADVRIDTTCERCGDPAHGKPRLVGAPHPVELNASSAGDVVVLAVGEVPVGIDVERSDRFVAGTADSAMRFTDRAWPAVRGAVVPPVTPGRCWTAGEALAKGLGLGLAATGDDMARAVDWWALTWLAPTPGTVACLATPRPAPAAVVRRFDDALGDRQGAKGGSKSASTRMP